MIWSYEYFVQMSISARRSLEIELRRFLPTCQNSEDLFSPKLCCSAMADDEVATLCSQFQAGNWVVLWCSYLKPNPKPLARACSIARMLSAQNWMKKIRLGCWSAADRRLKFPWACLLRAMSSCCRCQEEVSKHRLKLTKTLADSWFLSPFSVSRAVACPALYGRVQTSSRAGPS